MRRLCGLHSHFRHLRLGRMRHVRRLTASGCRWLSTLDGVEDRYRGVHVDLAKQPLDTQSPESFQKVLRDSVSEWKQDGCVAIWLRVPILASSLIPIAASEGFEFHHAEGDYSVLCQWLQTDTHSRLPPFATHQVGVAGCVLRDDTKEVIVVKDKHRSHTLWKFPGGLSEVGEDIGVTAEREVFEETGVKTECRGILAFRQQHRHPGAFGRSDLYFVCHLVPLTFDLHPCAIEIDECRWIGLAELEHQKPLPALMLRVLQLVRQGLHDGFENVVLEPENCKSMYVGNMFKMYNTPFLRTREAVGEANTG
ncbi:hypothetical protein NP493_133g00016 [Ridgeia piscesae]|uniref:Nucleoside diphosphate-linked moiety X motif 6 n=1 Tax=Ridgeia piscesae TaxID=27915 RepID=A0AAD9P578_RIDPI|nr:hypothetical protein NP493_133g00016 [Ridgeia piscesae]